LEEEACSTPPPRTGTGETTHTIEFGVGVDLSDYLPQRGTKTEVLVRKTVATIPEKG